MFNEEEALQEILDFLEFRKERMNSPFVTIGEKFVPSLENHFDSLGITYTVEDTLNNNKRFTLTITK